MVDIDIQADELLAELGIATGDSSSFSAAGPPPPVPPPAPPASSGAPPPVPPPPATSGAPPPPPPPPPPPASSGGYRSKKKAQEEVNDVFNSVISFASKTSAKKSKIPPPVAPKPKRKIHVSSVSLQKKSPTPKDAPKLPAPPAASPTPPPAPKKEEPKQRAPSSSEGGIVPKSDSAPAAAAPSFVPPSVPMVAFGPGLETFEVNCFGDFQISCPHDVLLEDLAVTVKGPTGTKPVEIDEHGNGQFSCSYLPANAGDHIVSIKVDDEHIPGSPFTAHVQFAQYTDKCKAEGPGLVSGTTTEPCQFTIRSKTDSGYARMRIHVVGPSKAEPIEMVEDSEKNVVIVTYHPSAPGDYTVRVLWGDANVHGSPFTVPVTGDFVNDASKVRVTGEGLKGGSVNEPIKLFVEGEAGAGPGPLGVRMVGPSKPSITADDSSEEGVELTILCQDPGEYQLILKWGSDEVPSSPYTINVAGEGRQVRPDLCTASGSGISEGSVGDAVKFTVDIPDTAGPGSLGVSVAGPHPPKPIEIINHQDGTMEVTYHPIAPGDYKIDVMWANEHISGSPFTASISGIAVRNAKEVNASGEIIKAGEMKCSQLGTINVVPNMSAGAGPLRAKLEGPAKAELELAMNPDSTMLVSFIPKDAGEYKLHLLWGEGEDDENEINGSPFLIKVSN